MGQEPGVFLVGHSRLTMRRRFLVKVHLLGLYSYQFSQWPQRLAWWRDGVGCLGELPG